MRREQGTQAEPTLKALAIRRVRSKSEMKEALREISIVAKIQEQQKHLSPSSMAKLSSFEEVIDWWVTPEGPHDFSPGQSVFGSENVVAKRERRPTSYKSFPIGSSPGRHQQYWVVVLKPLYAMDLKRFIQSYKQQQILTLDNAGAWTLAHGMLSAGKQLHSELGQIHRDIKPKNIMLRSVNISSRPRSSDRSKVVVIDFGFAGKGELVPVDGNGNRAICLVEPGKIKGELGYVLAQDAAQYRACQRGDVYAMGKTLWEVLFVPETGRAPSSANRVSIQKRRVIGKLMSHSSDSGNTSSSSSSGNSNTSSSGSSSSASILGNKSLPSKRPRQSSGKIAITPTTAQRLNSEFRNTIRYPPASRFQLSVEARTILVTLVWFVACVETSSPNTSEECLDSCQHQWRQQDLKKE